MQRTMDLWFSCGSTYSGLTLLRLTQIEAAMGPDLSFRLRPFYLGAILDVLVTWTSEAQSLGLFGAPSCVVGGEVFWGNDRVEDAVAWARRAEGG